MKLRDHPGLLDGWPPQPGGTHAKSYTSPIECLDTLQDVFIQRAVGADDLDLAILTVYHGEQRTRDVRIRDNDFAQRLCDFLRKQSGKTIDEIGDLEIDF